jgi:hypothetical protein
MVVVESPHPPGVIGFTGAELARYHHFTAAWAEVQVPEGTSQYAGLGYDTACNSNDIIKDMLSKPKAQWVWIMDDDHLFAPETCIALLDADVDVIIPLYAQRVPPFRPCIFGAEDPNMGWPILSWSDLEGKSGIMPVASGGKGGILIRRRVIENMTLATNPEWLVARQALNLAEKGSAEYNDLAEIYRKIRAPSWFEWEKGRVGEDHTFFKKCLALGYQPYVHLDVNLGHLSTMGIWPHRADGKWCGRVNIGGNAFVEYWDKKYAEAPVGVQE